MRGEWPPQSRHPGRELGGVQPSEAKPSEAKRSEAKPSQAEGLRPELAFKAVSLQRTFPESRAMAICVWANSRMDPLVARLAGRHVV